VIEGARLLPWFQETARRDRAAAKYLLNCEACMTDNPPELRRAMGCGYIPGAPAPAAAPAGCEVPVTVCVGYSTKLPEVAEAARARLWWSKGQLRDWCEGDEPTIPLRLCIEEMEIQANAVQAHALEKPR
jgi:hypothetical protein